MIAPRAWLIWLSALLVVPTCALATLEPQVAGVCLLLLAIVTALAIVDAALGRQRLEKLKVESALLLEMV